jgi:hypothetical protein
MLHGGIHMSDTFKKYIPLMIGGAVILIVFALIAFGVVEA